MSEVLLVIFLLEVFYNVTFHIIKSWKNQTGYLFVELQNKYGDDYIVGCVILVGIIFAFGIFFGELLIVKLLLLAIVFVFGYALYLDFHKKLYPRFEKYIKEK